MMIVLWRNMIMNSNEIIARTLDELDFSKEEKELFYKIVKYAKLYQLDKSVDLKKNIENFIDDYTVQTKGVDNEI